MTVDIQELNRRAVLQSVEVVAKARDDQWDYPTPCGEWSLRQLLAHMVAQHNGFAAAADGETEDDTVWREEPLVGDLRAVYAEAAQRVVTAFAAPGVTEREFWLPEIRRDGRIPGRLAISFHLVDYVVHGWDVGAAIGAPPQYDEDVVAAALQISERFVPDGPNRRVPGASFAPAVPAPAGGTSQDRLLALLGRSPTWPE